MSKENENFVKLTSVKVQPVPKGNLAINPKPMTMLQEEGENGDYMFAGIAVHYNTPFDRFFGEMEIRPGAFNDNLASPQEVRILYQHNSDWLIGQVQVLEERPEGLYAEFIVTGIADLGRQAIGLIQKGFLKYMSVGFEIHERLVTEETPDSPRKETVTRANLREISLVSFPADENAEITDQLKEQKLDEELSDKNKGDVESPCSNEDLDEDKSSMITLRNKCRMMKIIHGD